MLADVGSEASDGGRRRVVRRSSEASENMERTNEKGYRTRKTSDGSAGSVRRRLVWQEQKSTQNKRGGENGPQMAAFDEARRGLFIRESETVRDKYSTRKW